MDMQHGLASKHAAWIRSMGMQHGHVAWACIHLSQDPCLFPAEWIWALEPRFQWGATKEGKSINSHSALPLFFALFFASQSRAGKCEKSAGARLCPLSLLLLSLSLFRPTISTFTIPLSLSSLFFFYLFISLSIIPPLNYLLLLPLFNPCLYWL